MQFIGTPPPNRRIIRIVGSGGMGVVYEAMDERLKRRVALKMLHPHLTMQPETRDYLLNEAQLAARVEHENVVRIYNVHEVDTGLCLEMEFINGVSLSRLLDIQPFPPAKAVDMLQQALQALVACHAKDVVHADLKPGNLLVTQEGKVLLADFGIARAVFSELRASASSLFLSGPLWGTPQYCPPEAWKGGPPDKRWDLYSLGILTHEALAGELPFQAETPAVLMREKLEGRVRSSSVIPDISGEFSTLLDSLAASAPEERPESAEEALKALKHIPEMQFADASTRPMQHREETKTVSAPLTFSLSPPRTVKQKVGSAAIWISSVIGASIALIVAGIYYYDHRRAPVQPAGKVGYPMELTAGIQYAVFSLNDGRTGNEVWMADSKMRVYQLVDANPGKASSNPRDFLLIDGKFMFTATTRKYGAEPWVGGTLPGDAQVVEDLQPGWMSSYPEMVIAGKDRFYFRANPLTRSGGFWVSNGNKEHTGLLREVIPEGALLDSPNGESRVNNQLWAVGNIGAYRHLIQFDPDSLAVTIWGKVSTDANDFALIGDRVVFAMDRPDVGRELFYLERESESAHLVRDINRGPASGNPVEFFRWKDAVYFRARSKESGIELWKTDGTPEGTVMVHDLNEAQGDSGPTNFIGTEDRLFFRAAVGNKGLELCATTGDPDSTAKVYDLNPGPNDSTPYSMARIGDFLCFTASGGELGEEFWALDLTHPEAVPEQREDIVRGPDGAEPHNLVAISDTVGIFIYWVEPKEVADLMLVRASGQTLTLSPYNLPAVLEALD